MRNDLQLSVHETDAELYESLTRLFPEIENNGTRWVRLNVDGVKVTFFAPAETTEEEMAS